MSTSEQNQGPPDAGNDAPFEQSFGEAGQALSSATVAFHQAVADRLGLHITDHKALGVLLARGPLAAGELGSELSLSAGSATALIDRLEQAGYVRRRPDPDDRRRVLVEPIEDPEVLAPVHALFEPMTRHFAAEMPDFSEEEQNLILDFIRSAVRALRAAASEVRAGK